MFHKTKHFCSLRYGKGTSVFLCSASRRDLGWCPCLGDGWFQPLLGCVYDFRAFEAVSVRCFNTPSCKNTISTGHPEGWLLQWKPLPSPCPPPHEEGMWGISHAGLWGEFYVGCKSQRDPCKGSALHRKGPQHHRTFQPAQQLRGSYSKSVSSPIYSGKRILLVHLLDFITVK